MPDPIHLIPLEAIDDTALARDRTGLDPEALTELRLSIAAHGLRMPIELFPLAEPRDPLQALTASSTGSFRTGSVGRRALA